jgi:microcystin-dependent protein
MSSSNPPNPNTPPVFNNDAFNQGANPNIDTAYLNANYLRFPTAQGGETLQNIQVLGSASFTNAQLPTSLGVIPASTDSSTTIPTTAWVQSAIIGGSSNTLTDVLIAGNNAGSQPINMNNQNISAVNTLSFATTSQNTAYTGAPAGTYTNINMTIDSNGKISSISSGSSPSSDITGAVISYAGNSVPTGYLKCDGTQYSTTTYAALFAVIGYTYGGTGSLFSMPNLVSKYIQGSATSAGATTSGNFTISNSNIQSTAIAPVASALVSPNISIIQSSPNGINDWGWLKGKPSGDSSVDAWFPYTSNGTRQTTTLPSAFTTTIGTATPTPITGSVPSVLMMYLIKT